MLVNDLAIDNRVLDASRRHYKSERTAGEIIAHLLTGTGVNRVWIEDGYVGSQSRSKPPTVGYPKKICGLRSQPFNRGFQPDHSPFARPGTEQVGWVAGVAVRVDVRAAVA